MIQDFFVSFRDNIKEKSTNPFFGTLILVWVIRNWKLLFGVFNFDKETTLEAKLNFISEYFDPKSFAENLLVVIGYTFLALITSYLLLSASRLIVNFFDKVVTPCIYRLTDESSIVLKSDYDNKVKENFRLEARIEEERAAKIKFQEERDSLEKKLFTHNLTSENTINPNTITINEAEVISNKIMEKNYGNDFEDVIMSVRKTHKLKDSEAVNYFSNLGLLQSMSQGDAGGTYKLTPLGEEVRKNYVLNHSK